MGHRGTADYETRGVATVGFDYMFVTSGNVYSREEWSESAERDIDPSLVLKALVVRDYKSNNLRMFILNKFRYCPRVHPLQNFYSVITLGWGYSP